MSKSKAALQAQTQDFIDDMIAFTSESVEWCAKESEHAAHTVGSTINFLLNDAKRMASMSTEALAVLHDMRAKSDAIRTSAKASDLIVALKKLRTEEADVLKFADPVIEALQFQDRVTQQMGNMVSMIAAWAATRSAMQMTTAMTTAQRMEFGETLMKCTTMVTERDLIRLAIPEMPEEESIPQARLF